MFKDQELFGYLTSLLQQHSYKALTVDGTLKLVSMYLIPSSTISPLQSEPLSFHLFPVVSILKLLISTTSNNILHDLFKDIMWRKSLCSIYADIHFDWSVCTTFENSLSSVKVIYVVWLRRTTKYNRSERIWKAPSMVFFNILS